MPQPDSGNNCCDCPSRSSPCDDCGGAGGACCHQDVCSIKPDINACAALNGYYFGDGTTCFGRICSEENIGCCLVTFDCIFTDSLTCSGLGGLFQGLQTYCCRPPQFGFTTACCQSGVSHCCDNEIFGEFCCALGTNCCGSGGCCPEITHTCCEDSYCCDNATEECCAAQGGCCPIGECTEFGCL